jgi:hypothetical protein
MPRRKSAAGATHSGGAFPSPPAIPEPPETDRDRALKAETMRLLAEIKENLYQQHLARAVNLALMAQRRQGPLVEFFVQLGRKYADLADNGPQKPRLRIIDGGGDR